MSREICGHQYTTGRTCGWNEKVHGSSSSATHDYSPAVLVPLPLDLEAGVKPLRELQEAEADGYEGFNYLKSYELVALATEIVDRVLGVTE